MIILGLDPGIGRTGFGVIDTSKANPYVRCGCLTTPQNLDVSDRLNMLGEDLSQLIATSHPDVAAVEQIFFGKNHSTAMLTAQARGVLLYILRQNNIPVESLTPLQIKSRLTGYGAAPKSQVQSVVRQQLHLDITPQPDDAADALAAALCIA
ncbi:MAG: crossover junction endodeoxyribonuclease RuvC [Candidatus Andersenbacteria bacterium]|nr:crossover junction endodeoxyribonuclease RuvC [Candidatus Andersenbacteria bacterium]MBI3250771.1 crossover junction endodeoxyribonuclease RuvC [Candidatus Andersenbacteria bacterium]